LVWVSDNNEKHKRGGVGALSADQTHLWRGLVSGSLAPSSSFTQMACLDRPKCTLTIRDRQQALHADVAELVDAPASEAGGPGP
jgi:hypothetical protein